MAWRWRLLRAGSFRLDGGSMFGVVPKPLWSRLVEPDALNRIPMQTNCLLLEQSDRRVLIETGNGDKFPEKQRAIYDMEQRSVIDALLELGVHPESIDTVIVTHLHFDHAGGLTRRSDSGEPEPTFPNARIIVQRTEWEDALAGKSTMSATYLRENLDPVADLVSCAQGEVEAAPQIIVQPAPGHTWGLQTVRFRDEQGRTVLFPSDVMPTAHHVGLAYSMGYDQLPYENMQTKRRLLEQASAESWLVVLGHEPGHAVMRVEPDPERVGQFRLTPETDQAGW